MPCFLPYGGSKAEGIRQCADGEAKGKGGEKALATGKKKKMWLLQLWELASLKSVAQTAGWKSSGRSKAAVLKQNFFFLVESCGLKTLQLIGRGPPSPL